MGYYFFSLGAGVVNLFNLQLACLLVEEKLQWVIVFLLGTGMVNLFNLQLACL